MDGGESGQYIYSPERLPCLYIKSSFLSLHAIVSLSVNSHASCEENDLKT